jgi:hypothetical protein
MLNRLTLASWPWKTIATLVIFTMSCSPAIGQEQPSGSSQPQVEALQNSIRDLKAQLTELTSVLRELKVEVQELRAAREDTAPPSRSQAQAVEEEQQLLNAKVEEQYQTKVESASRYRVRLSGIVLLNLFNNRGVVDNPDFPSFIHEPGPADLTTGFGGSLRQSMLGFEIFGPSIRNARVDANAQFDLAGAPSFNSYQTPVGLLRLRTAVVRMTWAKTTLAAGQDVPFFSPLSPTSVSSLALPAFSYSGNLWTWQPQLRAEHRLDLGENASVLIQGGILSPLRSHQPAYATRFAWNRRLFQRQLTIGAASYYSRQDWGFQRGVNAWAGSSDWTVPLTQRWDLSGEFYRGKAVGQLGGGINQTVVTSGNIADPATQVRGLNSTGGWTQLKFRQTERIEWNAALGQDNPLARDLRAFPFIQQNYLAPPIARNRSTILNIIYRPRSDVLLSGEYRWIKTFTLQDSSAAHQTSLSMGVLF